MESKPTSIATPKNDGTVHEYPYLMQNPETGKEDSFVQISPFLMKLFISPKSNFTLNDELLLNTTKYYLTAQYILSLDSDLDYIVLKMSDFPHSDDTIQKIFRGSAYFMGPPLPTTPQLNAATEASFEGDQGEAFLRLLSLSDMHSIDKVSVNIMGSVNTAADPSPVDERSPSLEEYSSLYSILLAVCVVMIVSAGMMLIAFFISRKRTKTAFTTYVSHDTSSCADSTLKDKYEGEVEINSVPCDMSNSNTSSHLDYAFSVGESSASCITVSNVDIDSIVEMSAMDDSRFNAVFNDNTEKEQSTYNYLWSDAEVPSFELTENTSGHNSDDSCNATTSQYSYTDDLEYNQRGQGTEGI